MQVQRSLSARRAWIEIRNAALVVLHGLVALRKESVDRNIKMQYRLHAITVALRKESVDRNASPRPQSCGRPVALRKESVDRNTKGLDKVTDKLGRSPQGERG